MMFWRIIRSAMLLVICSLTVCGIASCEAPAQGFEVYFLDVGQGDATVILCDGEVMMVDGGPPSASQFIYSFLRNTLQLDHIDIMLATHPHADPTSLPRPLFWRNDGFFRMLSAFSSRSSRYAIMPPPI